MPEATINDIRIEADTRAELNNAAVQELLRQRALAVGLLEDGADDDTRAAALEQLLEQEVSVPQASDSELERYYTAHARRYCAGELVFASHILLQVTSGVDLPALQARAEAILRNVRDQPERFDQLARENSNCPSSELGGSLGQLQRGETVPEFDAALFSDQSVGLWPQLVRTRFGFHILRIDQRVPGKQMPFDVARERVAMDLQGQAQTRALEQYVRILAGQAKVVGVDLGAVGVPLVN